MLSLILRTFNLLSRSEKKVFAKYQLISIVVAALETASIALIAFAFALFAENLDAKITFLKSQSV